MFCPIYIIERFGKWLTNISTILKYVLIAALMAGCFIFGKMSSCNKQPALESIRLVKDPADQKTIDTLKNDIGKLNDSVAVLNYQLDENANQQDEARVNYKVKETYIKIESSDKLYSQFRIWLSGNRPLTGKRYEVDSGDVMNGMLKKNDYDYCMKQNELLKDRLELQDKKIKTQDHVISDFTLENSLKDDQIMKLEAGQVQVVKRKWYIDAAIIIGSFAAGYGIRAAIHK